MKFELYLEIHLRYTFPMKLFKLLFFLILIWNFPVKAQSDDSLTFIGLTSSNSTLPDSNIFFVPHTEETINLDKYWLYQNGDDSTWANPAYDDSHWDTLSTTLNMLHLAKGTFTGSAWFRLHMRIDSSLRNKSLALLIDQWGASEIYFNGEMIDHFGDIIDSTNSDNPWNPKMLPALISFGDSLDYVLAIRYSNLNAQSNLEKYRQAQAGFTIELRPHNLAMQALRVQSRANNLLVFYSTFSLCSVWSISCCFCFTENNAPTFILAFLCCCFQVNPGNYTYQRHHRKSGNYFTGLFFTITHISIAFYSAHRISVHPVRKKDPALLLDHHRFGRYHKFAVLFQL
ncbi:MAG: hypothetical protein R2759_14630 [Bacteroidales bacterium]